MPSPLGRNAWGGGHSVPYPLGRNVWGGGHNATSPLGRNIEIPHDSETREKSAIMIRTSFLAFGAHAT